MVEALHVFLLLVVGHAVADYPLQGDFLSRAKNRFAPVAGAPWYQAMGAHAAIHGGAVGIITGNVALGLCEFLLHWRIDDAKCKGAISYNQDQALHVACKVIWATLFYIGSHPWI